MNIILVILLMLALSAFFSGMEIAYVTANKLKIELDKSKGLLTAHILSGFFRDPSRFIGTLLLGNNIALVIYGIAFANLLEPWLWSVLPQILQTEFVTLLLQTLIATLVILIFAEFLPKTLFRINPNAVISFFAIPLVIMYYLMYPIVLLFTGASQFIIRQLFNIRFTKQDPVFSPIDLDQYIHELSQQEEHLEDVKQEIQMFQNVIGFRKVKLRETMLPRNEIIAVEEDDPMDELKTAFIEHGFSRIPVYSETIDNIIGYVHAFDMFRNPENIKSVIKPILFIPETMPAKVALTQFIREGKSIAVVVDEFGGTSGLVTIEDMMEEIFGEIEDEFDEDIKVEKVIRSGEYIFSARLEIDYLNNNYKLDLPESEEYETLAGLIIHYHENIPSKGETILINPFRFNILQASEARIELVRLSIEDES
ncbi:MAG: hemolysin family protein [Bacteroidales bacterium]|nr:hemolysin family protein [Bacteroidales bacterium]